ncbi:hypothetical protein V8C43DRAFT_284794 [Trichoderma afarasin]
MNVGTTDHVFILDGHTLLVTKLTTWVGRQLNARGQERLHPDDITYMSPLPPIDL